jgi:hypothetical protein
MLSILSCSKEKDHGTVPDETSIDGTVISFAVTGINDAAPVLLAGTSGKAATAGKQKSTREFFTAKDDGYDAILEVIPNSAGRNQSAIGSKQQSSNLRASAADLKAAALPTTAKYRILLYDAQNKVLKKEVEIQSGQSPKIPVNAGEVYNWYAVSTSEGVPPTVSNGVISKSSITNKDVLYAKGTITPTFGKDNRIGILFQHLNVAYSINLDARGAFATINGSTQIAFPGADNMIYSGDLNIVSGTYVNETAIPASSLTSSMTTIATSENTGLPIVKNAVFYSSRGKNFNSNEFSVKFNQLSLTLNDDNSTVSFTDRLFPFAQTFNTSTGNLYTINVKLQQGGGIDDGFIIWAPTNLVFDPTKQGFEQYRFRKNNAYSIPSNNEYWNWQAIMPDNFPGINDPCTYVYPTNTWRMPTAMEFARLSTPDTRVWESRQTGGVFFSWMASGVYAAWQWKFGKNEDLNSAIGLSNPKTLILPLFGYRTTSGTLMGSPSEIALGLGGNAEGHYWGNIPGQLDQSGLAGTAGYKFIQESRFFIQATSNETRMGNTREGRNIRCVRDKQ